ncbi:bacterial Ig-like domain-containing protein [Treponema sp. R6D11]
MEVTTPPTRTFYAIGESIDLTGLVVKATYSDDDITEVTITADNISGFNSDTAGIKTITVTLQDKTATFTVTVGGDSKETAIPLPLNTLADGYITTSSDEQWFSFTATASTQYIHADFGTLFMFLCAGI